MSTRAALLTGLYAHQAGIGLMEGDSGFAAYRSELSRNAVTVAEVLRLAGYGLMGGLVRLPVKDKDILIFSNVESSEGRHHGTVWASFDGAALSTLKPES